MLYSTSLRNSSNSECVWHALGAQLCSLRRARSWQTRYYSCMTNHQLPMKNRSSLCLRFDCRFVFSCQGGALFVSGTGDASFNGKLEFIDNEAVS